MICQKEFSVEVSGSCSGLTSGAPWIYIPDPVPPAITNYSYSFSGYYGAYSGSQPVAGAGSVITETHRLEYVAAVPGGNVKITHRCVGTIDLTAIPGPSFQTFVIRAYSNGVFQDVTKNCPFGAVTNWDLTAEATGVVVVNNVLYVYWIGNNRGSQSFSGIVTVQCL